MPRNVPGMGLFAAMAVLCVAAGPAVAQLVINEIDYDQPGTDTTEFLELKNIDLAPVDLTGYVVELVNGNGGGAVLYLSIPLPSTVLAPGAYFVICANAALTPYCDLDVTPDTNLIQNGAPDAVGLRNPAGVLIDAVSYEGLSGAPYVEGTPFAGQDDALFNYLGISRYPDGSDTNDNATDWSPRCATPGGPNHINATNCLDPVPTVQSSWGTIKANYQD